MVELAYVNYSYLSKFVQMTGGVSGGGFWILIITEWTKAVMSIHACCQSTTEHINTSNAISST